ncbi:hypothetical protein L6164_008665 [Bauhinia variegata]|uniref:Uncharacterized protein n=1 Tax=Bauhinia variegata TaxID=167791 RepID=A0ACB9PIW3_BAUVA|nr:hypothetical protein L6164_008665 [Bauhinia variegata]
MPHETFSKSINFLFLQGTREWNSTLVHIIFEDEEARIICCIPLPRRDIPDQWYWKDSKDGIFTVRSCYRGLVKATAEEEGQGISVQAQMQWKLLWKVDVPPKYKHFIWRCCKDMLPTTSALCRRGMDIPNECPCCCYEEETIIRALFGCEKSQVVWTTCMHFFEIHTLPDNDFDG